MPSYAVRDHYLLIDTTQVTQHLPFFPLETTFKLRIRSFGSGSFPKQKIRKLLHKLGHKWVKT